MLKLKGSLGFALAFGVCACGPEFEPGDWMLGTYSKVAPEFGIGPPSLHRYFFRESGEFEFWPHWGGGQAYFGTWEQVSDDTVRAYLDPPDDPAPDEWPWWERGAFEIKRERSCEALAYFPPTRLVSRIDPETGERNSLAIITAGEFCTESFPNDGGWQLVRCGDAPTWEFCE